MVKKILFMLTTGVFTQVLSATPLEELAPVYAPQLRAGSGSILETQLKNPSPRLLPVDDGLRRIVTRNMNALGPGILAETLYLYKKPENTHTNPNNWNETQKTGIYNQLLAISSLAGIQYYSATRGAMRTFFETSPVIDAPNTKRPLPDPVYNIPPQELSLYARQKDLTFGDNVYQYQFITTQSCIVFIQENITSLTYGIIPVIGKGNLRTILAVFDCGDSLLIYGASMAKAASVPGMGDRIGNSFGNRAEAIISWFTGRANMVYN